ncbi:putative hydrolase [Metapseudomonas resinovorans NBRC 106553]|uniref:Putative hydrolase n=1 Tax=Metapseudomonas resinovorans NBRC 106553 TaxID=1245471 RepID=S6AEZ9_METRE|nr:putative hydrolase [Pseudomonas resinovorans NBRC 106553]
MILLAIGAVSATTYAQTDAAGATEPQPAATLFRNVRIFDGQNSSSSTGNNVLVRGNLIERVSTGDIESPAGARVIDGGGRTLMPGLIDAHWHAMFVRPNFASIQNPDVGFLNILATAEAHDTLMRGFTTVRDVGGSVFALKRAIDQKVVPGPRIFPSGAMISVTSGHGDFRQSVDLPRAIGGTPTHMEQTGNVAIADTPDEVRVRVREQLMQGASQIKLTAGGGVSSPHSPLDVTTFTEAELRAAVEAAENWGTYVAVHAYTPQAVQRAIAAGVKCIEHGSLMDEETAKYMASRDIWLSIQPFPDELANAFPPNSEERRKAMEVFAGNDNAYALARKYKLKTAFGTDVLFSAALATRQGQILASLSRWYSAPEILTMATSTNAELLSLSGKRNPYPGALGVVREGAFADLILVDGDPAADIGLVANPAKNFLVIMKDGVIYKDVQPQ